MVCSSRRLLPTLLVAVVVIALGVVACGDSDDSDDADGGADGEPSAGLSVTVDPEAVRPGQTLQARVVNETDTRYTYGAAYELEREVDGEFERVPVDKAFIQIAYIAQPGEPGPPVAVEVPRDAEPGRWRVILDRDAPGVGELAAPFEVSGDGD